MPELPDVETYRRYLAATALHQTIKHVHVDAPSLLADTTPQGLGRALAHHRFEGTYRHGKYLFAGLDSQRWLVLHFGMTGRLEYFKHGRDRPRYTQFLISFTNGFHLAYVAPRKLGRLALTDEPQVFIEKHRLGPDALALDMHALAALATRRRGCIKSWLLDQKAIAGIGNIYGDEILFQARLDPRRRLPDLTKLEIERLFRKMHDVLERAVAARADPARMPRSWLIWNREKGGHCPRCQARLCRIRIAGRTAWYCPRCQR